MASARTCGAGRDRVAGARTRLEAIAAAPGERTFDNTMHALE